MKRIPLVGFALGVLLLSSTIADARFLLPIFRLDCGTAGPSGTPSWPIGCQCVQSGWVIGGSRVDDDVIGCHLGLGENDRCNFHGECTVFFGGGGGEDISSMDSLLVKTGSVASADSVQNK